MIEGEGRHGKAQLVVECGLRTQIPPHEALTGQQGSPLCNLFPNLDVNYHGTYIQTF